MPTPPTDRSPGNGTATPAPRPLGSTDPIPEVERIVVGVDGSPTSMEALVWAARQAARCHAELRIVSAWAPPDIGLESYEYGPTGTEVDTKAIARVRRLVEAAAERARRLLPADRVDSSVGVGGPAEVLIEQSRDADLLVVGSRGLGGFRGLLLGSVSQQCAGHAACPVVVVRGEVEERAPVTSSST